MKFDAEICEGVSCPECPFNKGEDGCLLAKRFDEIEIIPEPCEDAVPRASVEYICRKNTVSTNPYEHKYHDKFIQFMDDPEISDFGRWQHSNGFNTALVAVKCDLDKVPSAQPSSSRSHENDLISRWAVIRAVDKHTREDGTLDDDISCILEDLPSAQPESAKRKMSNNEWIDFLVSQFDVSRTSAKEMLHGMMRWKKEDNFKKQFNERRRDGRPD